MLAMGIETITSIIQEHEVFITENPSVPTRATFGKQTGKDLRYLCTLFKSFHLRSKALEERLRNEINLVFRVNQVMGTRANNQIGF
jgi:hypothetical protein